jgi:hypothetical protein
MHTETAGSVADKGAIVGPPRSPRRMFHPPLSKRSLHLPRTSINADGLYGGQPKLYEYCTNSTRARWPKLALQWGLAVLDDATRSLKIVIHIDRMLFRLRGTPNIGREWSLRPQEDRRVMT